MSKNLRRRYKATQIITTGSSTDTNGLPRENLSVE